MITNAVDVVTEERIDGQNVPICQLYLDADGCEGNARLIASAPHQQQKIDTLLAALKGMVEAHGRIIQWKPGFEPDWLIAARAAILAAEGGGKS
jgi:arginine/ornithine N-succinyltransferase beta subunit